MTTTTAELVKRLRELASQFSADDLEALKQFRSLFVEQEDCALAIISKPGNIQLLDPPHVWFAACSAGMEIATLLPALEALSAPPSEVEVEAVARAIHEYEYQAGMHSPALSWEREPEHERHHYRHIARAALTPEPR